MTNIASRGSCVKFFEKKKPSLCYSDVSKPTPLALSQTSFFKGPTAAVGADAAGPVGASSKTSSQWPLIVGGVGGFLLAALVVLVAVCVHRRVRQKQKENASGESVVPVPITPQLNAIL